MIALSITNYNDINLAKAFLDVYDLTEQVYIHFSSDSWVEMYGTIKCKYGSDTEYLIMHAQNFKLFITFSAPPNVSQKYNYTLVSFFNEIGTETLEMQHGLFQYGINNLDDSQRCGFDSTQSGWGLNVEYPAKNIITWKDNKAIGYLKSDVNLNSSKKLIDEDYTLIITNNNWHIYNEYDKFTFISCIVKLLENNTEDLFIWKPHPAELSGVVVETIKKYSFKNLKIIGQNYIVEYPAEVLIKECKFGISMISTTLIDFDFENKPTLLFKRPIIQKLLDQLSFSETFENYDELLTKYTDMKINHSAYILKAGVKKLDKAKLMSLINQLIQKSNPVQNPRLVLEYLDRLAYTRYPDPYKHIIERSFNNQEADIGPRSVRSMLFQNTSSNYTIEEILRSIENRIKMQSSNGGISVQSTHELLTKLNNVQHKLHDYQKSTVAYKIKKFFKRKKK